MHQPSSLHTDDRGVSGKNLHLAKKQALHNATYIAAEAVADVQARSSVQA
jgi:hypothetical protein